jgi:ankyrin repeat protein
MDATSLGWGAVKQSQEVLVKMLLDAGSDVISKGNDGCTALNLAFLRGNISCLRLMRKSISGLRGAVRHLTLLCLAPRR